MMIRFLVPLGVLFTLGSCLGLNSNDSKSDYYPKTAKTLKENYFCSQINRDSNLLDYKVFQRAMKCWGWDIDYPHFYSAVQRIDSGSWNYLMEPTGRFFLGHSGRRKSLLNSFYELDRGEKLDDLVDFVATFIENNFYDLIYKIINVDSNREKNGFDKGTLFEIMEVLNSRQDSIVLFKEVYSSTVRALENDDGKIGSALRGLLNNEDFVLEVINTIDELFRSLQNKNFKNFDRNLIKNFLEKKDESGNYWFHQWVRGLDRSSDPLKLLLSQKYSANFDLQGIFSRMMELAPSFICQERDGSGYNYIVNTDNFFREYLEKFINLDYSEFPRSINGEISSLHLMTLICNPGLQLRDKNIDVGKLIRGVLHFVQDERSYLLIQKIHESLLETENISGKKDPYYFINVYLGGFYNNISRLYDRIEGENASQYFLSILNIISSYSKNDYNNLVKFFNKITSRDGILILEKIGKIWLMIGLDDKKSLFRTFNMVFKENWDYVSILKFFGEFVKNLDQFMPLLSEKINKNNDLKNKTIKSLSEISKEFRSKEVIREIKEIYSYRGIVKIIRTLARASYQQSKIPPIEKYKPIMGDLNFSNSLNSWSQDDINCMEYLTGEDKNFQNFIIDLPRSCKNSDIQYFPVKLLDQALRIKTSLGDHDEKNNVVSELLSHFLLLKDSKRSVVTISNTLSFFQNMITGGYQNIERLENFLQLVKFLLEDENFNYEGYLPFLRDKLASLDDQEISKYIKNLAKVLKYYALSDETKKTFVEKNSCEKTYPLLYRLPSCPDKKEVKDNLSKIVKILKRKFKNKKTFLDLIVEFITPDYGLELPFWTKESGNHYKNYVFTLENYLTYFYDLFVEKDIVRFYTGSDNEVDFFDSKMRLISQLEITTRDSSFHGGFFGLMYFNSIAQAHRYIHEAEKKLDLFDHLSFCLNSTFCSKALMPLVKYATFNFLDYSLLPKEAKFWSLNTSNTSSSLILEEDKYTHNGKIFNHNMLLQAFLAISLRSSPDDVNFTTVFKKMSDQYINTHNGEIVFLLANLSAFQNMARFVYDRFGQSRKQFDKNLGSNDLQRVNRNLFKGIKVKEAQKVMLEILNKHTGGSEKALSSIINSVVDWLYEMPYGQQRIVEEVVADLIVITSSLGSDDKDPVFRQFGDTYASNNIFEYTDSVESIILIIDGLLKNVSDRSQLFYFFNALRDPVRFIRNGLSTKSLNNEKEGGSIVDRRKVFYIFLNESFRIFNTLMVKKSGINFIDLLRLKVQQQPKETMSILKGLGKFFHHPLEGGQVAEPGAKNRKAINYVAEWLTYYSEHSDWKTKNIRRWIFSPSFLKLIDYFLSSSPDDFRKTNLSVILNQLFHDDYESFVHYTKSISEILDHPSDPQ